MLEGLRVLDLSDESGWLAGKILGDMGADVIKVEPPGGDLARTPRPLPGRHRRSRAQPGLARAQHEQARHPARPGARARDLPGARAPQRRAAGVPTRPATSRRSGSITPSLCQVNPRLVHCAITPFGQTGPRAHWRGGDLIAVAMGGNLAADRRSRAPARALQHADRVLPRRRRGRDRRADGALRARRHRPRPARRRVAPGDAAAHGALGPGQVRERRLRCSGAPVR